MSLTLMSTDLYMDTSRFDEYRYLTKKNRRGIIVTKTNLRSGHPLAWGLAGLIFIAPLAGATSTAESPAASPQEWNLIGGNEYEQHFSELRQIDTNTVGKLKLKWFADMPTRDGLTGIPIVANGMVFQSGGLGRAWAHDVRTGKLLWSFDAEIKFPLPIVASWGSRVSRGLSVWGDKVLKASGDCRLFALDQKSGAKIWEVQSCDSNEYKAISGAPRVGDGKVFIGNSNSDFGIGRGYVDAYEIATGKRLWRFHTIPGDPAKGFENKAMEMASKTWGHEYWKKVGGGSAWDGITYDPRTKLVLIGVDGPSPVDPTLRGKGAGDELFTNAVVAVNAETGEYVWHYSTTPGDAWNYSATQPTVLADLTINGVKTPVVMIAPKIGFFYVLDARTGKLVNEPKPIVPVNWASRIDMKTGRPVRLPDAEYWTKGEKGAIIEPGVLGAHSWMPMSYSPLTGLVYIPVGDYPTWLFSDPANAVAQSGADQYWGLKHGRWKGSLLAWDPIRQERRWEVDTGKPYQGGILSTASNVVFQGHTDGKFVAFDAASGKQLWAFDTGSAILAAPSTVEIDGEQLVLVPIGSGTTSALGFAPLLAGSATSGPARLLAFSLNGGATLPAVAHTLEAFPKPAAPPPSATLARAGKRVWDASGCEICHGVQVIGGIGSVPDLRRINSARLSLFSEIVRGGLLKANGMPIFAETIREEDIPALKAYIIDEAWRAYRPGNSAKKRR